MRYIRFSNSPIPARLIEDPQLFFAHIVPEYERRRGFVTPPDPSLNLKIKYVGFDEVLDLNQQPKGRILKPQPDQHGSPTRCRVYPYGVQFAIFLDGTNLYAYIKNEEVFREFYGEYTMHEVFDDNVLEIPLKTSFIGGNVQDDASMLKNCAVAYLEQVDWQYLAESLHIARGVTRAVPERAQRFALIVP